MVIGPTYLMAAGGPIMVCTTVLPAVGEFKLFTRLIVYRTEQECREAQLLPHWLDAEKTCFFAAPFGSWFNEIIIMPYGAGENNWQITNQEWKDMHRYINDHLKTRLKRGGRILNLNEVEEFDESSRLSGQAGTGEPSPG